MNRIVGPWAKWIDRLTCPPRDPSPEVGRRFPYPLELMTGRKSSLHLSLAMSRLGNPTITVSFISNR